MSTWFPEVQHSMLERLVLKIIRHGIIPKHIAFIMDGNRRYAKKLNEQKTVGHLRGFEKLTEALSWCRDLGITQTTLYTFSIENFKRPQEEIDYLMELFRKQANKVMEEFSKIEENEICIRVYGKIDLLPLDIQQSIARMSTETANFNKMYLNLCFAYTAREEMTNALNDLQECVFQNIIQPSDINESTISNAMYSLGLSDPDILVRTSGEIRLSDFLLWQSSFSSIFFLNTLWPELSIWHLFAAILNYQYEYDALKKSRQQYFQLLKEEDLKFCREVYNNNNNNNIAKKRPNHQNNIQGTIGEKHSNDDTLVEDGFEQFLLQRQKRIEQCCRYIKQKRIQYLYSILNKRQ